MGLPTDLFEPKYYANVRRPVEDAETLPPWAYAGKEFYARETERIFNKTWNFVGHAARIPNVGDYTTLDYAGASLILVRDREGRPRAYANSCRHRGAAIAEGSGNCRAFKCPYHHWIYGLDGALTGAPEMEHTPGFTKSDHGLIEVKLELFGQLMFVNFDPNSVSLAQYLGDLPQLLAPYALDELKLVRRTEYEVACNWKVYVENFMDYYHTPTVHQKSLAAGNLSVYHRNPPTAERGKGEYMALYAKHEGSAALLPGAKGFPPMPKLSGRAKDGSTYVCLFPCTLMAQTKDCTWHVEIHPLGPDRIKLAVGGCFHPETIARPDFAETLENYYKRWDISVIEDNEINEIQQKGVSSPLAKAGRVSNFEALSHIHRNWVLDRVIGNKA